MQVTDVNDVRIFNLTGSKSLPEWLSERARRRLVNSDIDLQVRSRRRQAAQWRSCSTSNSSPSLLPSLCSPVHPCGCPFDTAP